MLRPLLAIGALQADQDLRADRLRTDGETFDQIGLHLEAASGRRRDIDRAFA